MTAIQTAQLQQLHTAAVPPLGPFTAHGEGWAPPEGNSELFSLPLLTAVLPQPVEPGAVKPLHLSSGAKHTHGIMQCYDGMYPQTKS